MFRLLRYALTALVGFLLLSSSLWAQSVELIGEDRISVRAKEIPIRTLLEKLSEIVPLEVLVIDPSVERLPISVDIQNVSVEEGIRAILEEAGVNYVLWGGNGKPFRVFAGSPDPDLRVRSSAPETDEETGSSYAGDRSAGGEATLEPRPVPRAAQPGPATGGAPLGPQPVPGALPRRRLPQSAEPQPGKPNEGGMIVPGIATPATAGAGQLDQPDTTRVALTAGLLGLGLLFGMVLVRDPEHERHRGKANHRH